MENNSNGISGLTLTRFSSWFHHMNNVFEGGCRQIFLMFFRDFFAEIFAAHLCRFVVGAMM